LFNLNHIWVILGLLLTLSSFGQSNPVGDSYEAAPGCYVVTSNQLWQLGAVWFNESLDLNDPFDITLTMTFGNNDDGADGMVFVFQQVGINAIGVNGGGIGFEGFSPSFGVELDTWQNIDLGDPFEDHMAMFKNGTTNHNGGNVLSPSVQASATSANIEDGGIHTFQLTWDPAEMKVEVFFDCELRLSETVDLLGEIFGGNSEIWWGFTGATGGASNEQTICISEFALGLEPNYEMCAGEGLELGVVGGADGDYSWEPALEVDNPASPIVLVNPAESMEFTVTYTDICGEETSLSTWVEVIEVELALEDELWACEGETILIEATGNADQYEWSTTEFGTTIEVDDAGNYSVTASVGTCELTETIDIGLWPLPEIVDWEEAYEACEDSPISIDASSANAAEYNWSNGETDPIIEVLDGQILDLDLVSAEGCENSYSTAITFLPYPDSTLPEQIVGCENSPETLTAAMADTWIWENGGESQSLIISESGTYVVTLSSDGCETIDSTQAIFNPQPVFSWVEHLWLCQDSIETIALPNQPYQYSWQGADVQDSVQVIGEGTWILTGVDVLTGCQSGQSLATNLLYPPEVELEPFAHACDGAPALVDVIASDSLDFFWSHGEVGPEVSIAIPGDYYVVAQNICGTDTAMVNVSEAVCSCPTYIPNSFSPDFDDVNEVFFPHVGCDVFQYRFAIYNRWGHVVFESFKPGEGWNGSGPVETHFVDLDVYAWQLTYETELFGGWVQFDETGTVFILR
jgi:hypothetical protein